jgi:xanthine/CO dehydrogenase XdhC/CoxF family maturation factor
VLDLLIEPFDAAHPPPLLDFRWNGREPVEWTTHLPDGESLVEVIRPQRAIVVFGGGPDVEPVVRCAQQIGWRADVVTTRDPVDVSGYDAAVVMTHNSRDVEIRARCSRRASRTSVAPGRARAATSCCPR